VEGGPVGQGVSALGVLEGLVEESGCYVGLAHETHAEHVDAVVCEESGVSCWCEGYNLNRVMGNTIVCGDVLEGSAFFQDFVVVVVVPEAIAEGVLTGQGVSGSKVCGLQE
jgi:hypothetical protein